jgi:ubiquinone/menaquinone biosynthesis C-methylase UbiE
MIKYYLDLLKDRQRIETFQKAVSQSVREGDVVLDLGTGLGTFAFFAAKVGAKKVYGIDKKDIVEMAKELCKFNNLIEKVIFYKGNSDDIDLPEKVDLIVTEMLWSLFISKSTMKSIKDAREKFLKEKGRIMPESVRIYLAPVGNQNVYNDIVSVNGYGIDWTPAAKMTVNNLHQKFFKKGDILSAPKMIKEINLMDINLDELPINWHGSFRLSHSGTIHGLAGWMDLQLTDDIILSNSPLSKPTVWENIFFPIDMPLKVSEDDTIEVGLKTIPFEGDYEWSWDIVISEKGERASQSTFKGFPVSKDFFRKKSLDYIPVISHDGEIIKAILELFNCKMKAKDIAEEIQKRFPNQLRDIKDALGRVEGVIGRYSK